MYACIYESDAFIVLVFSYSDTVNEPPASARPSSPVRPVESTLRYTLSQSGLNAHMYVCMYVCIYAYVYLDSCIVLCSQLYGGYG